MIEYIQHTVADLDRRILDLQTLRQNLLEVFGPIETVTLTSRTAEIAPTPPQEAEQPVKTKRKYTRRSAPATPGRKAKVEKPAKAITRTPRRAPKATTAELLDQIGSKLKQPFSTDDLMAKTGIDRKKAANTITKWIGKEWVVKVSRGAYERTDAFGGSEAPGSEPAEPDEEQPSAPPAPARPAASTAAVSTHDLVEGSLERKVYFEARKSPELFTAGALGIALGCSRDAISITLVKLERKGFVKQAGEEDGERLYKTTSK